MRLDTSAIFLLAAMAFAVVPAATIAAADPTEKEAVDALRQLAARLSFDDRGRVRRVNFAGVAELTDDGLLHVNGLDDLEELYLGGTRVTDAGLQQLRGLTRLRFLSLHDSRVTRQGIEQLRDALPGLRVFHEPLDPSADAAPPSRAITSSRSISPGDVVPPMGSRLTIDPFLGELRMVGGKQIAAGARASWSPDGTRIAMGKVPLGAGIQIVHVESTAVAELLTEGKDPAWSPGEGRWIAYTRDVGTGSARGEEVWLVESGGGAPRKLADGAFPTWSADAATVFFFSRKTRQMMSVAVDAAAAEPVVLWEIPRQEIPARWYPVVSPDGRHVAYHAVEQLEIVDVETSRIVRTSPLKGWRGLLPGWSPDSRFLGFGALESEEKDLWLLDISTGKLRRLLSGWSTLPSWSPDGTRLAFDFRSPVAGYQVWVIELKTFGIGAP